LLLVLGSNFSWYQVLEFFFCDFPSVPFPTLGRRIPLSESEITTSCHLSFLFYHHGITQHYHPLIICDGLTMQLLHEMVEELWFTSTIGSSTTPSAKRFQ
jgi:hypothetical protein